MQLPRRCLRRLLKNARRLGLLKWFMPSKLSLQLTSLPDAYKYFMNLVTITNSISSFCHSFLSLGHSLAATRSPCVFPHSSSRHVPRVHSGSSTRISRDLQTLVFLPLRLLPLFLVHLIRVLLRLVALLRLLRLSLLERPSLVQVLVTLLHLMVQQQCKYILATT